MPVVTLTQSGCTAGLNTTSVVLYERVSSPQVITFTNAVNTALKGVGVEITKIRITGKAKNTASSLKQLQVGFKPSQSAGRNSWAQYNGSNVLDSAFTAVPGTSSGETTKTFTLTYSETSRASAFYKFAGHIKEMMDANTPVYLGIINPREQTACTTFVKGYWQIEITYELLGNIPVPNVSSAILASTSIRTTIEKVFEESTTVLKFGIKNGSSMAVLRSVDLGTGTTDAYTVPSIMGSYFKTPDPIMLTIRAATKLNGVDYGYVDTEIELCLPSNSEPTASCTVSRLNATIAAYVQNQNGSTQFKLSGSAKYSGTIAGYTLTIDGTTYEQTSNTFVIPKILSSGTVPYSYTVSDTRGLTRSYDKTITVLPWSAPTIGAFSIKRVTNENVEAIDGTYARVTLNVAVSSLVVSSSQKNWIRYKVSYRAIGDTAWTDGDTISINNAITDERSFVLKKDGAAVGSFNDMLGYEFKLSLWDIFTENEASNASDEMPTKETFIDINESTGAIGFGGDAPVSGAKYAFHDRVNFEGERFGWHVGDSITITNNDCNFAGMVSNSTKTVFGTFYLGMPIYASGVTASGALVFRGISGYLNGMSYTTGIKVGQSGFVFEFSIVNAKAGWVAFSCTKSSAAYTNVSNNTPIAIMGAADDPLVITFTD